MNERLDFGIPFACAVTKAISTQQTAKRLLGIRGAAVAVGASTMSLALTSPEASASELGCKVLLCLAGPWTSISECVPPVHQVLRDVAKGKPFPSCDEAGNGTSAKVARSAACPEQYLVAQSQGDAGVGWSCAYSASSR